MDVRKFLRYRQATGPESTRLACTAKRRWKSKRVALQFARSHRQRYGMQEPYKCPVCKGWHLTSGQKTSLAREAK